MEAFIKIEISETYREQYAYRRRTSPATWPCSGSLTLRWPSP